jgi:hypothetical protein
MKRTDIKRRPLSDTVIANLEAVLKEYRELDCDGLYFRVKPDGKKAYLFRYKKTDGKWSWLCCINIQKLSFPQSIQI